MGISTRGIGRLGLCADQRRDPTARLGSGAGRQLIFPTLPRVLPQASCSAFGSSRWISGAASYIRRCCWTPGSYIFRASSPPYRGSKGGWKPPGQSWKMVRGSGPAGKGLTQPLAGWGEGHGDENHGAPHFFSLPLFSCVVRTPDKLLPRKCAWRRSERVRDLIKIAHANTRSCAAVGPLLARSEPLLFARLCAPQIPTVPRGVFLGSGFLRYPQWHKVPLEI